jgi:uncharacterized protein DUF4166
MIGAPRAGADVPVSVAFEPTADGEIWRRSFAGREFRSVQIEGEGRWEGLVRESFGPIAAGLACVPNGERLDIFVRRFTVFGIPMPVVLAPGGEAYETVQDGRFRFHVEMRHPLTGLIVRYRGWLEPVSTEMAGEDLRRP